MRTMKDWLGTLSSPIARLCSVAACAAGIALTAATGAAQGVAPKPDQHAAALQEPPSDGSPLRFRLLTSEQYLNTLSSTFGPDFGTMDTRFAPMTRTSGLLASGAAEAEVNESKIEAFQAAAAAVAAKIVDERHRGVLFPCVPASAKAADDACAGKFLAGVGRLLYRRPLDDAKLRQLVTEAGAAAGKLNDFYGGLAVVLEGMLISPEVLYVEERAEPDPQHPGRQRLDAYSLASRLSLFLWDSTPDEALLDAAQSGEIQTPKGRARIVDAMLKSPRLEVGMRVFFDDMLQLDDLNVVSKDPKIYPLYTGETTADAREQTLRTIVDQLITKKKDYRDLFTTHDTFLSTSLGAIYDVPVNGVGWTPYESPPNSQRVGLLSEIAFLADHAHPGRSSPTRRGKALREILLCQQVPRPPPNVDFSLVDNPSATLHTAREKLTAHRKNPVCAGCHRITDPIGLALEDFDGAGQFRTTENGETIDTSGDLNGKHFNDAAGLAQVVHDDPAVPSCLVTRLFAYGAGGPLSPTDNGTLAYLNARFAAQGYRLPDLLRTIALSNAFSEIDEPPADLTKAASLTSPVVQQP